MNSLNSLVSRFSDEELETRGSSNELKQINNDEMNSDATTETRNF